MKGHLCILLCIILPYAIGMDHNDHAKDEGLSSSPEDDDQSCAGDQSPESPGSSPLPPSRGPSRSRSVGQLGRIPYTIVSPRKVNPRYHGAGGCVNGSAMAPVPEGAQAFAGLGNVAGLDPSTSAASSGHGSQIPQVERYGLSSQRSLPDLGARRRHNSAIDRPSGSGLYTSQDGACGSSKTKEMFAKFENLNLSSKMVPKISSRAVQNRQQQQGATVESLRSVSRNMLAMIRGIHSDYVSPLGMSNPSARDHRTLMRLLERVSSSLQAIRDHPESVLGLPSIDSDLFALTSTRIPEVLSDIRRAVDRYDTPDIDHGAILRNILAKVLPDLFTIAEQIRGAI